MSDNLTSAGRIFRRALMGSALGAAVGLMTGFVASVVVSAYFIIRLPRDVYVGGSDGVPIVAFLSLRYSVVRLQAQ